MLALGMPACAQGTAPVVDESAARLEFAGDHFSFDLPLHTTAQAATIDVDLVDRLGLVRSHASGKCQSLLCRVELPPASLDPHAPEVFEENLPLFRVRYRVTAAAQPSVGGVLALDRIAPRLFELHLSAPSRIRPGAEYAARVRAIHPLTHVPLAGVVLQAVLTASYTEQEKADAEFAHLQASTDADGFATIRFKAPADDDLESVDLAVVGLVGNLRTGTTATLRIPLNERFELTTDKPLYQPGQTVHARLLLLDRKGHASAAKKVRVDVHDPDQTLVYRATATTSTFGIAAIDWAVPARMRLGDYSLQAAVIDDDHVGQSAIASLRLSRYDLPTFVVSPKPDRSFYLPGMNATVEVRADYLFGKPVPHGHVRVVREDARAWNFAGQRYDVKQGKAVSGELDASGSFKARIDLSGDERESLDEDDEGTRQDLHFAAYVTDASTGRTEQRRFDLRITGQALNPYLSGPPGVRGLSTVRNLSVTAADGEPVECEVDVLLLPMEAEKEPHARWLARAVPLRRLHTDAHGLLRVELPVYEELLRLQPPPPAGDRPTPGGMLHLLLKVRDKTGRTGASVQPISAPIAMLRVDAARSIYRPGETIDLTIDSAEPALPLTVQLVRHTTRGSLQLAQRELTLVDGHAALSIPTDARYSGLVVVDVLALGLRSLYREDVGSDEMRTTTASRGLLFPRDDNLHVGVAMSAGSYRPGEEATAVLTVRGPQDPDGEVSQTAPSALGVVVVDQAVEERHRTDSDFGGDASSFFWNRYYREASGSAGGFDLRTLQQLGPSEAIPDGAQLAANLLLGEPQQDFTLSTNLASDDLGQAFRVLLDGQLSPVRVALARYLDDHTELPTTQSELAVLLSTRGIDLSALRDPWGQPYTLIARPDSYGGMALALGSMGPDKQPGTPDDFSVRLANWRWFGGHQRLLQHAIGAYHQRTGGYIHSLPTLREEMQAEGVDFDRWRDPWGQPLSYLFSVAQTRFEVEAQSPGDTELQRRTSDRRGPFTVGSASIDYTKELAQRVEAALSRYTESHAYPRNDSQLQAATRAAGISRADLSDPWHHPLYAVFRSRSIFTDNVRTEAHATPGTQPVVRTIVTPVTAMVDYIELCSFGPDGKKNGYDDFTVARLSRIRETQSARQATAVRPSHTAVRSGAEGDLSGTVTDTVGANVTGVTVVATHVSSGAEFETKSDSTGAYRLGPIPAGAYKVRFHLDGFADLLYDDVQVQQHGTMTLDAALNVASTTDTVTVTTEAAMLSTESASAASVVDNRELKMLSVMNLANVLPGVVGAAAPALATPRLRDYFPETLLWRPEVLTAPDGTATLKFPVADNITTWQLSAAASTMQGNTGVGAAQFRTFQPFFAAFDPPTILTVGDTVALPVTLRNYLDHGLKVESTLQPAPWFRLDGPATRTVPVGSGESVSPVFRFTTLLPVKEAKQEFSAASADTGDRIARPVTVHPDGQESAVTAATILAPGENALTLTLPADTLPGSAGATLKLYPNLGAHLRDALAAMSSYPDGCAEQILSIAWPSLLLERYGARLPQRDERLAQQTRRYLEQAYENLLANQLSSGGFAYWPRDPRADVALTAYAVEFLTQAGAYVTVDDKVIERALAYLAREQQKDGRWVRTDRDGVRHPGETRGNAMLTASVAAMIAGAPGADPQVKRAAEALQPFVAEFDEPYTLASYALATTSLHDSVHSQPALERLRTLALSENGGAYWALESNTPFFGWGRAGRVESTAQALRALLAGGVKPNDDLIVRGMLFLDHEQDRESLWYSTQATARVLDVLAEIALQTPVPAGKTGTGSLTVLVDGQPAASVILPEAAVDAGPIFVPLQAALAGGEHRVSLRMQGTTQSATAQMVTTLYRPWPRQAPAYKVANNEQLRLSVSFSTTQPSHGQAVTASVHLERIGFRGYGMLLAEIGLPPGADVDRASLESAVAASGFQLNHYEVLPDRILLYVWPRAGRLNLRFRFTLRYGIDALCAPSTVYDYYNPDARFDLAPMRFHGR